MTSADLPDEQTVRSRRASAQAVPVASEPQAPIDEATILSARRRDAVDPVDDGTVISTRRRDAVDPVDDGTVISTRRRPSLAPGADDTAPSTRRRPEDARAPHDDGPLAEADARALPAEIDDTVLSRRPAPGGADTVPELEDTLLRPGAPLSGAASARGIDAPTSDASRVREAHVPRAEDLRTPVPPRAVPTVTTARAASPSPSSLDDGARPPVDHESVERVVRGRERRRVLIVVVSVLVVAVASACALVLLLT